MLFVRIHIFNKKKKMKLPEIRFNFKFLLIASDRNNNMLK